ncbi:MAG TPA: hypothetical protein VMU75_02915 [Acidimicrobiales bacterium]|nr:hypothetical protein [Acidimicrobiales bacterium]
MPEQPGLERELAQALHRHVDTLAGSPDLPRRITERALARSRRRRRIAWSAIPAALGAGGVALGLGLSLGSAVPLAQRPRNATYGANAKSAAPPHAGAGAAPTRTTAGAAATAGGACAERSGAATAARAAVVVIARALPGPTVELGGLHVLASPARFAVVRYVKGHGPPVVEVETAVRRVSGPARLSPGGIRPVAGQTWEIVAPKGASPLATSVCDGSRTVTSGVASQP